MPKQPLTQQEVQKRLQAAARRAPGRKLLPGPRPAGAPARRPLLSYSEKERLQARIRADEDLLRQARGQDTEGVGEIFLGPTQSYAAFSTSGVDRRLRRNKAALQAMDPANHRLQGGERGRADRRLKELATKLRARMLTTYEMGYFPKKDNVARDGDYRRACDKSFKQEVGSPEFQAMAAEYKDLARRLDPDNPELANIERLRPRSRY